MNKVSLQKKREIWNTPQDRGYYGDSRREMLEYVPIGAKVILDVGCGEGTFGQVLKKHRAAEVWGIEIDVQSASIAKDNLNIVIVGDIENSRTLLPDNHFDCIVCNDVLEHLTDPWSILKMLREKLADKGCVVASIPNVRYYPNIKNLLIRGSWEYRDCGILDIGHLRFFTINSIKEMFDTAGYKVKRLNGIRKSSMSWKFELITMLNLFPMDDMRYERFAVIAVPKR
jgi:2-polyprenyl-3-methyl-5-hydroxy-6-metoxy-1,4-benzoquinol methylase